MLRSVCLYALCIRGAKHAKDASDHTLRSCRFLVGECEILCSSVLPLQPFLCSWYHVFVMDPIKDAPRHCAYSEIGFSLISNKYLQTSLEHAMNRACELSRPNASTSRCNSSHCVSMLLFVAVLACIVALLTNCGPVNRRSSTCLWIRGGHGVNDSRVSKS